MSCPRWAGRSRWRARSRGWSSYSPGVYQRPAVHGLLPGQPSFLEQPIEAIVAECRARGRLRASCRSRAVGTPAGRSEEGGGTPEPARRVLEPSTTRVDGGQTLQRVAVAGVEPDRGGGRGRAALGVVRGVDGAGLQAGAA